jgi:hypothetical protein
MSQQESVASPSGRSHPSRAIEVASSARPDSRSLRSYLFDPHPLAGALADGPRQREAIKPSLGQ